MQISKQVSAIILLLAFALPAAAQISLRENERGEKIIVYPDGSWQYFSDYGKPGAATFGPETGGAGGSFPVIATTIEPLEGAVSLTEADLFNISVRKSQIATKAADIARQRSEKAILARKAIEEELAAAQQKDEVSPDALRHLQIRLRAAVSAEQDAQREALEAQKESYRAESLTQKGGFVQEFNSSIRAQKTRSRQLSEQQSAGTKSYGSIIPLTENFAIVGHEPDLLLHPPASGCEMAFEGREERTGQWRRDVRQQKIFTHTDERLRAYLKDKEYLRCDGFMTTVEGYRYLTLKFTFAYPNAREAYGFIEKGSILTLKLINGDFVNLQAGKMDRGSYDTKRELLTYEVNYPLDRAQIITLKNSEIDAVRVFWSSGYEEYPVYQLDFFIQQIQCLGL